jgi:DNA polymerase elongation subunit (family B)
MSKIQIEDIESLEQLEDFNDEYVYDIEVENSHMFFANDILAHNSIYCEFGRITNQLNIPTEKCPEFVVNLWNYGCGPFMKQKYDEYAKAFNCDKNLQVLELEKIADTTILVAKKRYAMAECFKEPNIFLKPMEEVVYKGLEIVKGDTPPFARECQIDFTKYVLQWYQTHKEKMPYEHIIEKIKKYKQMFLMKSPDEISETKSIGDYNKFILDDKNKLVLGQHCPIHIKASGIYNYFLNQPNNKKYKVKYNPIKTADKVKWYYAKNQIYNCFAYLPGSYPAEYALEIDYDLQFEKTILAPCNRIIEILKYKTLTTDLCYTAALW